MGFFLLAVCGHFISACSLLSVRGHFIPLDNLSIFLYSFFRLDMYIRIGNFSTGIVHEQILTIPVRGMQKSGFWSVIPLHFGKYRKKLSVRYTQNCVSHPSPG